MGQIKQLMKMLLEDTRASVNHQRSLTEGVYDPGIFKAFFIAGGPGSGKSYVTSKTLSGLGMKVVDSDIAFETFLKKNDMSMKYDDHADDPDKVDKWNQVRDKAKGVTKSVEKGYHAGRLGVVVVGTGWDYEKISRQRDKLEKLGYDTFMLFVNTSLDVAIQRNSGRERSVPAEVVKDRWQAVQNNIGKFQHLFGPENFIVVDNNNAGEQDFVKVFKAAKKLLQRPPKSQQAREWIRQELEKKNRNKPDGKE
jgi:shikimate kinase